MTPDRVYLGSIIVAGWLALIGGVWVLTSRDTRRSMLDAGWLRRFVRRWRSRWIRALLLIPGWPHAIDVLHGTHKAPTATTPVSERLTNGTATLTRYEGPRGGPVVLIVHALLTRSFILDLTPERSLVGYLLGQGFDVFLLDWGDPDARSARNGFAEDIETLRWAETEAMAIAGQDSIHLVGYCFGGTLCLMRAAAYPHPLVASITGLASPIDVAVPSAMRVLLTNPATKPVLLLDGDGCVPAAIVRESFHALRPGALRAVFGARTRTTDEERRAYAALARWVWEHRRLSGAAFFDLIDLYRTNSLFEGTLRLGNRRAVLGSIQAPILLAVAERDHIVPSGSMHAVRSIPGLDIEIMSFPSGHVSMVCGTTARSVAWPSLAAWITARSRS